MKYVSSFICQSRERTNACRLYRQNVLPQKSAVHLSIWVKNTDKIRSLVSMQITALKWAFVSFISCSFSKLVSDFSGWLQQLHVIFKVWFMYLFMIHLENQLLFILLIRVWKVSFLNGAFSMRYFLASLKTVFADKAENILTLLKLIDQIPTLKRIVLTKKLENNKETEIRNKAKQVGIEIMTYSELRVRSSCY